MRPHHRFLAGAAAVALGCGVALSLAMLTHRERHAGTAESLPITSGSVERDGLRLELEVRPVGARAGAGDEAVATLTLRDARTGEPVRGATPRAWMSTVDPEAATGADSCKERIRTFASGLLSARAQVDLNETFLLAMNHDNTLSVIDPQISFTRTKLRSLVTLPGQAHDWAIHPDREVAYVTVPAANAVSVIDTRRFLATGSIAVGERPGRLAIQPDGRRIWVANDGDGTVDVVDHESRTKVRTLEVGAGPHRLVFADGGRQLWVTSDGTKVLRGFDTTTFEPLATLEIPRGPYLLDTNERASAVLVAAPTAGVLVEIDLRSREVRRRMELPPGASEVRFDPSGRWIFAAFESRDEVMVLDASSGAVRTTLGGFAGPDRITFTDRYAYVRNRGSSDLALVTLVDLERDQPVSVASVPIGQSAAGESAARVAATPFVQSPGGEGVIVASPADRAIYYYAEGMMAPMGSLKNYGREPRAVALLDRSLREVQPGVYQAAIRRPAPGRYDLSVALNDPRAALCLVHTIEGEPEETGPALWLEPAFAKDHALQAGTEQRLRFQVRGVEGEPLRAGEVAVLAFRPPGTWQWRGTASRVERDTVEVALPPVAAGRLTLVLGVPGRGVPLGTLPPIDLPVHPTEPLAEEATP